MSDSDSEQDAQEPAEANPPPDADDADLFAAPAVPVNDSELPSTSTASSSEPAGANQAAESPSKRGISKYRVVNHRERENRVFRQK